MHDFFPFPDSRSALVCAIILILIHDLRFTILDFSPSSVFHQSLMALKRNAATSIAAFSLIRPTNACALVGPATHTDYSSCGGQDIRKGIRKDGMGGMDG